MYLLIETESHVFLIKVVDEIMYRDHRLEHAKDQGFAQVKIIGEWWPVG